MNIGPTPASCTVFHVKYQFTKPPRTNKVPGAAKPELDKVYNEMVIVSADPSGRDVHDIAKRLVLGSNPYDGSDFRILQTGRMVDAMGLVQATTWEKLDGKAPESIGLEIETDDDDEGDPEAGGSIPPDSALN